MEPPRRSFSAREKGRLLAPLSDDEQHVLATLLRRLHARVASDDPFDPTSMLVETEPDAVRTRD